MIEFQSGIIKADISDHYSVFAIVQGDPTHPGDVTSQFRCHSEANLSRFKTATTEFGSNFYLYDGIRVTFQSEIFCDKVFSL